MKLYTIKVVAQWLNVTERRVRQLRDEGVLKEESPGLYDLQQCVLRYIVYLRRGSSELNDEKTKLTKAKREAAEFENGIMRGSLHRTEDIENGLKTIFLNIRSRMLALPAKLSPELSTMSGDQGKIFDRLKSGIDEALEEISDYRNVLAEVKDENGKTD